VQLGDDDLGERLRRCDVDRKLVQRSPLLVLDQAERVQRRAADARADLHPVPDRPEAQEAHAILSNDDQLPPLLGTQLALLRTSDVGGDEAKGLLAAQTRKHPLAIVTNDEGGAAPQPAPLDRHLARVSIDGVLHQLGDRLARVGL
jgi:hypothetical protein